MPPSRYLKEKLAKVKELMRPLGEIGEQMKSSVDGQLSMADPDEKAGTWHRLTLNHRIGERATTGAQPDTTAGPLYLPVRVLIFDLRERPELAGSGYSNHRNRRHIADGQAADVNVGYGASRLDSPMSAISFQRVLSTTRLFEGHLI